MLKIINAGDKDSLLRALNEYDGRVPPRGLGRTNAHREEWIIHSALRYWASNDDLYYPLVIEKSESPDFVFHSRFSYSVM